MEQTLQDRVVLVTGAARGLGRVLCRRFGAGGAKVVAAARTLESLSDVARDLGDLRVDFHLVALDVRDYEQCDSAIQQSIHRFGALDILVNNASGYLESADLRHTSIDDIQKEINVTFRGVVYTTKAVAERFIPNRSGTIINIASTAGIVGRSGNASFPLYAACKSAVIQFTEAMAENLAQHGVRCCVVSPCSIREENLVENSSVSFEDVAEVVVMQCYGGSNLVMRSVYLSPTNVRLGQGE